MTPKTKLKARPPEDVKPGHTKGLIFGPPGVGKTWFSLDFPAPYYIDTEGGADLAHYQQKLAAAGGAYMGPADGSLDFDTVIGQVDALATERHGFKTLVIDSITKLYQTAIANEAARLGDKDAFGASKKPAIAFMRRLVAWVMRLDMNVWFIAHETTEWGQNPKTGQREEIGKTADVWDKLIYELHLGIQAQKRGPARTAIVRKSRLTGFGEGEAFPLDYGHFAERYGRDFIEAEVKPITLASVEQTLEIARLLSIVKVDDAEVEKWKAKAGVDSFDEFTAEQAAGVIRVLGNKLNPIK